MTASLSEADCTLRAVHEQRNVSFPRTTSAYKILAQTQCVSIPKIPSVAEWCEKQFCFTAAVLPTGTA